MPCGNTIVAANIPGAKIVPTADQPVKVAKQAARTVIITLIAQDQANLSFAPMFAVMSVGRKRPFA